MTLLRQGRFSTVSESDERARLADLLQYDLGSGPCVDAVLKDSTYCPVDLAQDPRWPAYGTRVAEELGVRSMLSFRLGPLDSGPENVMAGLNMYSQDVAAFDEADRWMGRLLATHAAALVRAAANAERVDHLTVALNTNREIGAATGILMATRRLTQQAAFTVLRVASQDTNRKVSAVAADVIRNGHLSLSSRAKGPQDRVTI